MPFKASNVRKRRERKPPGEGTQLIPSAAVREWYESRLRAATNAMIDDYRKELNEVLQTRDVKKHFAQDASAESMLTDVMARLNKKWTSIFKNYAKMTAQAFTEKVDTHSKSTCWHSMTTAGIEQPRMTYTRNIENTLNAAQTFNNTLITNVQRDIHEKVFSAVMLSLTSPNPEEQGTSGIENALKKIGEFSRTRTELIARDQNSKLYASLNMDRMRDNGIEKFRWIHSSAGKVPRPSHVAKDDMIFTMDDPRLWTGPKADQGPPGWAINCLPGNASIQFAQETSRIFRRFYIGELIEVTTLSGAVLRGTPNHPVLTSRGWIALKDLDMFDYLVEAIDEMPFSVESDDDKKSSTIADLFALGQRDFSIDFAGTTENDFHGDGIANGDVDIVNVAGKLTIDSLTKQTKRVNQFDFAESYLAAFTRCTTQHFRFGSFNATNSLMCGSRPSRSFFGRGLLHALIHRFATVTCAVSMFIQNAGDDLAAASELRGDLFYTDTGIMKRNDFFSFLPKLALAWRWTSNFRWNLNAARAQPNRKRAGVMTDDIGEILERAPFRKEFGSIRKINRYAFSGHVFNLETANGWYVSGGIVTHNCRCRAVPVID